VPWDAHADGAVGRVKEHLRLLKFSERKRRWVKASRVDEKPRLQMGAISKKMGVCILNSAPSDQVIWGRLEF